MTVKDVFENINRPDLRDDMRDSLKVDATTLAGNFDAWVNFLQYGNPLPESSCYLVSNVIV